MKKSYFAPLASLCLLCCVLPINSMAATGNISETEKYVWSETCGWVNFRPAHGGVTIHDTHLSGFIWAANIGWIKLSAENGDPYENTTKDNWGVTRDVAGELSGYAWSETTGWINFNPTHSQVSVDPATGIFSGYAWSANSGYIHFQNASPAYNVQTTNIDLDGDTVLTESDICLDGDDRIDYDGDGVPDFCDPCPENNPDDTDSDGDTTPDCTDDFPTHAEYSADTDGDGLPDLWEAQYGQDTIALDADDDNDQDGLTNINEFIYGTSPNNIDSDGDGLSDLWEVDHNLDPMTCIAIEDSEDDSDVDGIDLREFTLLFTTYTAEADINNDGQVDTFDLAKIAATFGNDNICPTE